MGKETFYIYVRKLEPDEKVGIVELLSQATDDSDFHPEKKCKQEVVEKTGEAEVKLKDL